MKKVLLLWLLPYLVLGHKPCCPDDEIITGGRCGNNTKRINLNCTYGHMLLTDVILNGNKVSTEDAPNFIMVEDPTKYCIGQMMRNLSRPELGKAVVAVACFDAGLTYSNDIETSGVLTLTSVIFLVATVIVYVYLPQLRDLQGLCYLCMCISMAIGFLCLGALQLSPGFTGGLCTTLGFLIYMWMMSTFFWMNVICINVYRTVNDSTALKKTEMKQFGMYSLYAWGSTTVFFIVALITNFVEGNHWKPGFSTTSCWLNGRTETWIFFYGPVAFLLVSNVALFLLSSYALWRDTRQYEASKFNNLKHRFLLSLKLFLVMGISWVFEIASFAHGEPHIIWKIADIFNCLQGLVIFILLVVLRKRAMQGLANRGCCLFITKRLADKLSPHDESCDQQMIDEDPAEVRLS